MDFWRQRRENWYFVHQNQINIKKDNIIFISRLTDGIFPDYNQIIPKIHHRCDY